jgi:regulator of sirC expression with transglutaminase-like and TPR domain
VLDVPGHVLVLIGSEASPVVVDPFREGQRVTPDELAMLVQRSSASTTSAVRKIAAMANRAVLVRLLQNQASRAEAAGKAGRALVLYERMTIFESTTRVPVLARCSRSPGSASFARG